MNGRLHRLQPLRYRSLVVTRGPRHRRAEPFRPHGPASALTPSPRVARARSFPNAGSLHTSAWDDAQKEIKKRFVTLTFNEGNCYLRLGSCLSSIHDWIVNAMLRHQLP